MKNEKLGADIFKVIISGLSKTGCKEGRKERPFLRLVV